MSSYPVLWRDEGEPIAVGKLVIAPIAATLVGAAPDRHPVAETLPYADIEGVHIGRARNERLKGNATLIVELRDHKLVQIAVIGAGLLVEVADALARLAA